MKWLRLLIISNPSQGGGYKVNITQSEHQTITVSQSSSTNKTTGFTIEDYPTIDISLKADPGYTAGVLNHTSFTFSNDVREVDITATDASYSPNITYNGNMNVFLSTCLTTTIKIFEITTGTQRDNVAMSEYANSEAFALTLADNMESLDLNYKDNFYNLDPNCKYKITALKIGDTFLSDTDLSDGDPNISSTSTYTHINASMDKNWVKSVYKQCTSKELGHVDFDFSPTEIDGLMQSEEYDFLGEQIALRLYKSGTVSSAFFVTLSDDKKNEFVKNIDFFMTSYETNTTGLKTGNLVQNYFNVLKQFQDQYANDATATSILKKYDPMENDDFKQLLDKQAPDIFEIVYNIDSSNAYGFKSSLNGGLAYVLWIFYVYYAAINIIFSEFIPDTPIISTIPVSITFTNVTQ